MNVQRYLWWKFLLCFGLALNVGWAAAQIRMMPLGNSITDGDGSSNDAGYRLPLYNVLTNANISFDFVGSIKNGNGLPDNDHEGHGGFRANQITAATYLNNNPADAVFLEIGTNDISDSDSPTQVKNDIEAIVDAIHGVEAKIEIYLGTLIPRKDGNTRQANTDALNALLPGLVSAKSSAGYKIFLVDHAAKFKANANWQTELMSDDIHPNDDGYAVMANEWFASYVSNTGSTVTQFADDFNGGALSSAWVANPAYEVKGGELVNTSATDAFDNFLAIPQVISNANVLEFKFGAQSDFVGRAYTGAALMLDAATTTANGYLIFHNSELKLVRLYTIGNGIPGVKVAEAVTKANDPDAGGTFRVEWSTDNSGHHFCIYLNGVQDACLDDPNKLQGNAAKLFAGVMINGNTTNAIDDFYTAKNSDATPPAAVNNLKVTDVTGVTIALEWTATGDDDNTGTARSYNLRYSTAPIDAGNFKDATPVLNMPPPALAGTKEAFIVGGLNSGTKYYFALKATDEFGNVSELSNIVSGATTALTTFTDNFNRTGPGLGTQWATDPDMQIVKGTVQNKATADIWDPAIYQAVKNPVAMSFKWGPKVTTFGTNWCGMLVMANGTTPSAVDGYMIQRYDEDGKTRLWRVVNGQFTGVIDEGNSLAPDPKAGSEMKVIMSSNASGHHFDVYINDVFDRVLTDPQKVEGNSNSLYAGFFLESTLDSLNAIDSFTAGALPSPPGALVKESGDDQTRPVGQTLPQPLVVTLLDQNGNPLPDQFINFIVTSGSATIIGASTPDGNIRLEGEYAIITSPIETRNDDEASNGKYIAYPAGQTVDASAKFTFSVGQAGNYRVWTRSQKTGSQPGSWTISVDGSNDFTYDVFQGKTNSAWTWDLLSERRNNGTQLDPKILNLAAGTHAIEFKARWEDTRLDKILITADANFTPDGKEEVGNLTDANGKATARVTLGNTVGEVKINALHGNLPPVTFTATATVGAADSLILVSGSGQSGGAGKPVSKPLVVKVTDRFGNPLSGKSVSWLVTQGNGELDDYVSTSDAQGLATTNFTPGNRSANNKILALASYAGTPVEFNVTTSSGIADAMTAVSGNNQTGAVGAKLANPLVIKMIDAANKSVANYPVDINITRGGGESAPENPARNGGFETASGNLPSLWNLEGGATTSEVALSSEARSGAKSLKVNATRGGVGVSQNLALDANQGYTFSFWIKVKRGTARVTVRTNDAAANLVEKTIDVTLAASDSAWQRYLVPAANGVAGTRQLFFKTNGSAEFLVDEVKVLPNTGNDGQLAIAWTLGDTAMAQKVLINDGAVIDNRGALRGFPISFTANAKAGAAITLAAISGNGQIGSASQPLPVPLVVKVADNFGNGVEKVNVTFNVTVGNGKINGQTSTVIATDSTGLAKAVLTMGPVAGATNTVVATVQGISGSITFNAIAAIPSQAQKAGGPAQGSAGWPIDSPLIVRVTDNSGNRIGGFPVIFTVQDGGGNFDGKVSTTIITDGNGEAKAALMLGPNPNTQNKVVAIATANGQPLQNSPINFTVTAAKLKDLLSAFGNNQTGIVGDPLPQLLKAKVQDELGKGIKGQNVTFTVVAGGGQLSGNVTTQTVRTDSLGMAGVLLTLGSQIGQNNNQVRAETSPALNGSPVLFSASAKAGPPAALKEISGDSLSGIAGNPLPEPLVTQVTDKGGNAIANISVTFTVKSGGGNLAGATKVTLKTDLSGKAQVTLTLGSEVGRYNNVVEARAFNGSLELSNSPMTFVASSTVSSARLLTLQNGNRQNGKAGAPLANPFVVRILDRNNDPVSKHPVHFRVGRGGGAFANGKPDTTVSTNIDGLARATLTLGGVVRPDSQVVFASSNDGVDQLQNSPLSFVVFANPGAPSGTASFVDASSPTPADGVTPLAINAYVYDPFGNPVANVGVTIQISGDTKTFPIAKTDSAGVAAFSYATTKAGRKTISMKLNGAVFGRSASVVFSALAAEQMNMVSGQNQTGNVNTALPKLIAVNVLDKFNNGVPNHPVDILVETGGGRFFRNSPILTDSTGVASVTYVLGVAASENRMRFSANGLNNSPITFVANATNASAANLEYAGGNNQQATAGQVLPLPLAVRVTDANKRPVFGATVNFTVNFGGGNLNNGRSSVAARTDEFGRARVNWQLGGTTGVNTVRVEAAGLAGSPLDFQAIAASGVARNLVVFSGDGDGGPINQEMPAAMVVKVTDASSNGADGVHVFFELIQGTGTLTGGVGNAMTRDVTTANGGFAATKITFGPEVGPRKIRVTALNANGAALANSPLSFTVFGRAGAVKTIETVARTNNQRGTANKPLNFPLQIMAYDEKRNPVEGAQINFAVTQNSGFFPGGALNALVLTNNKGIAEIAWTIKGGANKAQASVVGSSMPALTFDATGASNNNFPIFADVPDQQKREGDRIEFVLSATDADNDPIRYGAKNLPLGSVFDSLGTRIFTWQPELNSAGRYEVSFMVFDSRGGVDEELVVIDVLNRNQAPQILSRIPVGNRPGKPDTTILQPGTPLLMKVVAKDPDGDPLSYRWYVNGKFAGSIFETFEFRGELAFNAVEAIVFDLEDTTRTVWSIKVPVELSSFTAQVGAGNGVTLNWKTGSEINNVGFNILRGRNQSAAFAKLNDKLIPANRDGNYNFIDASAEAGGRYYYKLEAIDTRGNVTTHGPIMVEVATPKTFDLSQNYPNPFSRYPRFAGNPTTQIQYQLPQAVRVTLSIYNMLGQEVRKLVDAQQPAGYHTAIWDGRDNAGRQLPTGVYHYRLQAGSFTVTKKMLMAK